jgi:antitoxin VapB
MINLPKETEELARRMAELRGTSLEEAVSAAIEASARAAGIDTSDAPRQRPDFEAMMAIASRCAARPVLDPRSADEIIGYDEFGLPR